jgi:outer membrane protein assembly factor BamB
MSAPVPVLASALVSVLVSALVLAGCTSQAQPPDEPTATTTSTTEPEPEPVDPYAVPTLPDGELEVQAVVKGRITPAMEDLSGQGQVVVTEELLILIPGDQKLHAYDRATGEKVWSTPVRVDKRGYGACPQPSPPDDATAIVVFSGFQCGLLDTLALEDGRRIARGEAPGALTPSVTDPVNVAGRVYYASEDGIHEVLRDGTTELVVANAQLGLRGEYRSVDALTAIAGSDVLMVRSDLDWSRPGGTMVGFRADEGGDLEEIWSRDVAAVHGKQAMLDNTFLRSSLDGVLVDTVRRGVVTPRMLTVDPDTGRRADTFVLQRDPPGGYPAWIDHDFDEETLVDARGQVFSAAGDGGFGYSPNIVRYDLARNRIAWKWDPDFRPDSAVSGYPLAVSDDAEHVYVLWEEYSDFRLVELDYETGRQQRVWRVPLRAAETLTHATGVLVGNQLVLYGIFGSRYDNGLGLVLRVGEG